MKLVKYALISMAIVSAMANAADPIPHERASYFRDALPGRGHLYGDGHGCDLPDEYCRWQRKQQRNVADAADWQRGAGAGGTNCRRGKRRLDIFQTVGKELLAGTERHHDNAHHNGRFGLDGDDRQYGHRCASQWRGVESGDASKFDVAVNLKQRAEYRDAGLGHCHRRYQRLRRG